MRHGSARRRGWTLLLAGLLLLAGSPARADAARAREQGVAEERASVAGTVVDAYSQRPLPDATVVLEPRAPGVLPGPGSPFVQAARTARTDAAGRYRFAGVPAGEYRLHVERLGYRASTVEVDLRGAAESRVSVGLDVEPVALQRVEVSVPAVDPADPYGRTRTVPGAAEAGRRRVAVERARQEAYLPSDVRALTHADVAEGITLGETDLFRALQRLPGVSAGDEFSAELWTRGAPWDQTRVHLDGVPLFNPVHGLGGFSGVNPDAVGAAWLHPGVQPAALGGGAAGVLDLRTRVGGADGGGLNGLGELSVVSARAALDRGAEDGAWAWTVAGRRTYADLLTGVAEGVLGRDRTYRLPYGFSDLAGRGDRRLGERSALEVSGMAAWDRIFSRNQNLLDRISARWGGGMARATLATGFGGVEARHTLGFSGFRSRVAEQNPDPGDEGFDVRPAITPSTGGVTYAVLRGEWAPRAASSGAPAPWSAGWEIAHHRVGFRGPRPLPLSVIDPEPDPLDRDHALAVGAAWASARWRPAPALAVSAGLRAEAGPRVAGGGPLRLAPRLSARVQAGRGTTVSAAAGRAYQYVQAAVPAGAPVDESFRSDWLFVLAGGDVPAARADVATLGAERWLGAGWLASATGYLRRISGTVVPDPTPGTLRERPLFVAGTGTSHGAEASLRRLTGRWTGSAAYSWGASEMEARGRSFPAPWDQRHVLDLTGQLRAGRWQLGAAFTAASGTPYTTTFQGKVTCERQGVCAWDREPWAGEPGARRLPGYRSLDLLAEWNRRYRAWTMSVFVQVHNATNHANPGRYNGFGGEYCSGRCWDFATDEFTDGLPAFPVIGLRAAF
ncbi:MAG TPA: TonB-dependent receptor [Longimicrobiaceae bacterium]